MSKGTKERVEEAIRALGYRPHRVARSLRTKTSHLVALVIPDIAKVMDHKLPGEAEMGDVYNRYDYLAEKRQALVKWSDHLARVVRKGSRPGLRLVRSGAAS